MHTIRLKIRDLEVEGIGFDSFEKFEPILNRAVEIWKESSTANRFEQTPKSLSSDTSASTIPVEQAELSINSFVARVGGDTCREILSASAGYLIIIRSYQRIPHEELLETARSCSRWKKDYGNNLMRDVKRMIEQSQLIENSDRVYSLPHSILEEMKTKIAANGHAHQTAI